MTSQSLANSENFALSEIFQNCKDLGKFKLNISFVEKDNPTKILQKLSKNG